MLRTLFRILLGRIRLGGGLTISSETRSSRFILLHVRFGQVYALFIVEFEFKGV
jgi:hypothetical protein